MTRASAEGGGQPVVGQWAVFKTGYSYGIPSYDLGEITKKTSKTFSHLSGGWKREFRKDRVNLVFCGSQQDAEKLAEQLQSSRARCDEEQRQAVLRKDERDAKLIARATGEQP